MRRVLAFFLGMIFGMVFLVGAIGVAGYCAVTVVKPSQVAPESGDYIGDFADMSIYDMVMSVKKLYETKVGLTNEETGQYFTLGEFLTNYNIDLSKALGDMEIPQEVLDIPAFEFFNQDNGVNNALQQIKVSTIPAVIDMFTAKNEDGTSTGIVAEDALAELSKYSVADLMAEDKGVTYVFQDIKLADILQGSFPENGSDNMLMYAVGQTTVGGLLTTMQSSDNIFSQLEEGGALEELGKLTATQLLGEGSDLITDVLGDATLASLVDENGFNPDKILNDLYIGSLTGNIRNEIPATEIAENYHVANANINLYENSNGDLAIFYPHSHDNDCGGEETCALGKTYQVILICKEELHVHSDEQDGCNQFGDCQNTHTTHQASCYGHVWYVKNTDGSIGEKATGPIAAIADVKVGVLMSDPNSLMSMLTNMKIGDLVGEENLTGIMANFKDMTVGELMSGGFDGLYLGELLGYQRNGNVTPNDYTTVEIIDQQGNAVVKSKTDGETEYVILQGDNWYVAQLTCKKHAHQHSAETDGCNANGACALEEHTHVAACYNAIWYEKTALGEHDHIDGTAEMTDTDGNHYARATGLYGALCGISVADLTNGNLDIMSHLMDIPLKQLVDESNLTGIMASFKDMTIGELVSGGFDGMYLGELLGYQRNGNVTASDYDTVEITDQHGNPVVKGKTGSTADYVILQGENWYAAQLTCKKQAHQHSAAIDGCNYDNSCAIEEHSHNAACYTAIWYSKTALDGSHAHDDSEMIDADSKHYARANGLYGALAGLTVGELASGKLDVMSLVKDMPLKDLAGEGSLTGIMANFKDMTVGQLMEGGIDGILLGAIFGYEQNDVTAMVTPLVTPEQMQLLAPLKDSDGNNGNYVIVNPADDSMIAISTDKTVWYEGQLTCTKQDCTHNSDCYGYVWYTDLTTHTKAEGLQAKLADYTIAKISKLEDAMQKLTLKEVLNPVPAMLKSLENTAIGELGAALPKLHVGELLGYTKVFDADGTTLIGWKDANDNDVTGISAKLASKTVEELQANGALQGIIDDTTLGEVMGDGIPTMLASLKDTKIKDLGTALEKLYVGELLGYTKVFDTDGTTLIGWKDASRNDVTGISAKLASKTVEELQANGALQGIIDDTTLGEVMGDGIPTMLASLKDTKIKDLGTAIELLYVGELLSYTKVLDTDGVTIVGWKDANSNDVSGITAKLASKTITELKSDGALQEIINDTTLGEVISTDGHNILAALKDVKIGELGTQMGYMYVGSAMGYVRKIVPTNENGIPVREDNAAYASITDFVGYEGVTTELYVWDANNNGVCDVTDEYVIHDGDGSFDEARIACAEKHVHNQNSCYTEVWYDDPNNMTQEHRLNGVSSKLCNLKIDQLNENAINDILSNTTLSEILQTAGGSNESTILNALGNATIATLPSALNNMKVGTAMGYTYDEEAGYWKDSGANQVKGINAKLSDMTMQDLSAGTGLTNIVTGLTMGELLDSGMMSLGDTQAEITENEYKFDIIFDSQNSHDEGESACSLPEYMIVSQPVSAMNPLAKGWTAQQYFQSKHSTDDHRGKWKNVTVSDFIKTLLEAM